MTLDNNGQPIITSFNRSRNIEKAVYGLKGLLQGVVADKKLNQQELLFLDVWLRTEENLSQDGDVVDLLDLIGTILEDGMISASELQELNDLINDIINYKAKPPVTFEKQINELLGLLSGIAADNLIQDAEIETLVGWLAENKEIKDVWPADVIIDRLETILEDGIVTREERDDLLDVVKSVTGNKFEETGLAHGMATDFFEDMIELIEFEGSCFCFTGKFVSGPRKAMESSVHNKGATTKKDVTKSVKYLVIGTLASRDWRFSSHGRKIEKALLLKKQGHPIFIVTERTLNKLAKSL